MLERVSGEGATAQAQKAVKGEIVDPSSVSFEEVLLLLFMQSGAQEQKASVNPAEIKTGGTETQAGKGTPLESLIKVAVNPESAKLPASNPARITQLAKGELADLQKAGDVLRTDWQTQNRADQKEEKINPLPNSEEVPKEKLSPPQMPGVKHRLSEINNRQTAYINREPLQGDTVSHEIMESPLIEKQLSRQVAGSIPTEMQEAEGQERQGLTDNKTPIPNQPAEAKPQTKEPPSEHLQAVDRSPEDGKDMPFIKQNTSSERDPKPYTRPTDQSNPDLQQEGRSKEIKTSGSDHRNQTTANHQQVFQNAGHDKVEETIPTTKKDLPTANTRGERSVNIRVEDTELSFRFSPQNHNVSVEVRAKSALENYITFLDAGRLQRNLHAIGVNLESLKINGIEMSIRNSRAGRKEWRERDIIDRNERISEKAGGSGMHNSGLNLLL